MSKSHDKSGADLPGLGADLPGLGADFAGHWFWDLCKSGLKTTTHDLGFTRQLTHKYGVKLPTHDLVCSSVSPGHEQNSTDILVVAVNFSRCSRNFGLPDSMSSRSDYDIQQEIDALKDWLCLFFGHSISLVATWYVLITYIR